MAVAIKIQTTPADLLTSRSQGWSPVRIATLKPVPGDAQGNPVVPVRVESFDWVDVTLFGIGNTDNAIQQLQQAIQQRGSDLYSYAMFRRVDIDALGVKVVRYRILLLHSFVELLEWAVAILAIAFAAVIFFQYVTTGQAPALKDLQNLWGSAVTSVGQAGATVVGGVTNAYVGWLVGLGGIALAFGLASKESGVKPARLPGSGSFGVRSGGLSARVGA